MLSKQVKDRRFMNKLKRTITGHRAVKQLGISPEVLADQERVSRAMPVPKRAFTGDPSRVPVLTEVLQMSPEARRAYITDTSSLKAMYPAGHMDWKIGGPELSPQK